MTFSAYILNARRALNLTQAELATLLRVDKQSVSNWECGRNVPWDKTQREIRRRLRPSINERILTP